eukprot:COSAG04_NODE_2479_length_4047_cov_15.043060_4_plen_213_part_00
MASEPHDHDGAEHDGLYLDSAAAADDDVGSGLEDNDEHDDDQEGVPPALRNDPAQEHDDATEQRHLQPAAPPPGVAAPAAPAAPAPEKIATAWSGTAFDSDGNLTKEYLTATQNIPPNKDLKWKMEVDDDGTFVNDAIPPAEGGGCPEPEGKTPGLNTDFWEHLTDHGHDHDFPTADEIFDPLFLFFCIFGSTFWNLCYTQTNLYAAQVIAV